MKISINGLKDLCEKITIKAEKLGLNEVAVDIDYYWDTDNPYKLDVEKPKMIVGSFIDDWNNLEKILKGENPPTVIDFDRLGNVIKIIGESIHKSGNVF